MDDVIEAKGVNGQVQFDGRTVTITRSGLAARATIGKGTKQIPVGHITAVQWKPPGWAMNGYIAFTIGGGVEGKSRYGSATIDATKDENAVVVTKKQAGAFEVLRDAVMAAVSGGPAPAAPAGGGVADELARLAELHSAGHLTAEEYAAAKSKALGV